MTELVLVTGCIWWCHRDNRTSVGDWVHVGGVIEMTELVLVTGCMRWCHRDGRTGVGDWVLIILWYFTQRQ